jgi:hypothetical protein
MALNQNQGEIITLVYEYYKYSYRNIRSKGRYKIRGGLYIGRGNVSSLIEVSKVTFLGNRIRKPKCPYSLIMIFSSVSYKFAKYSTLSQLVGKILITQVFFQDHSKRGVELNEDRRGELSRIDYTNLPPSMIEPSMYHYVEVSFFLIFPIGWKEFKSTRICLTECTVLFLEP